MKDLEKIKNPSYNHEHDADNVRIYVLNVESLYNRLMKRVNVVKNILSEANIKVDNALQVVNLYKPKGLVDAAISYGRGCGDDIRLTLGERNLVACELLYDELKELEH